MALSNLPVLSSITDQLTGTVSDAFKKLVQPHSLVAAAIFITLNLVLVFPSLVMRRVSFALALAALPTAWQVALGVLVLIALGYLINSLGTYFLNIVNGNAFRDSPLIGALMLWRQRRRFDVLDKKARDNQEESTAPARAAYTLRYEFPRDRKWLGLTRLGNVLLSAASYTSEQYGVHLESLWPVMDLVLKAKDPDLHGRLREGQEALIFLASVTVLLGVVAVEVAVIHFAAQQPLQALWALVLLASCGAVYSAATQKALARSRDIRAAFDLYLDAMAQQLGLHALDVKNKESWQAVSEWLVFYEGNARQMGWYTEPNPDLVVQHSPMVSVQQRAVTASRVRKWSESCRSYGLAIDYLFTISYEGGAASQLPAQGCFLLVSDSRIQRIPTRLGGPAAPEGCVDVELMHAGLTRQAIAGMWQEGCPPALYWPIGSVPTRSSCTLRYTVYPSEKAEFIVQVEPAGYTIERLDVKSETDVTVGVRWGTQQAQPAGAQNVVVCVTVPEGQLPLQKDATPDFGEGHTPLPVTAMLRSGALQPKSTEYRWTMQDVSAGRSFTFSFQRTGSQTHTIPVAARKWMLPL